MSARGTCPLTPNPSPPFPGARGGLCIFFAVEGARGTPRPWKGRAWAQRLQGRARRRAGLCRESYGASREGIPGPTASGRAPESVSPPNRARHRTAVCRVKPRPVRESSTKNVVAAEQSEAAPVSFVSIRDSNHPIAFHSCPFVVQTTLLHSIRGHSWFKPPSCIPFVAIRGSNHPLASHSWPFVIQTTLLPPIRGHS